MFHSTPRGLKQVVFHCVVTATLSYAVCPSSVSLAATQGAADQPSERSEKIRQLIAELGAEQYVRRERAANQLSRFGIQAFEALLEATRHPDVEVAMRARGLLANPQVNWSLDGDSEAVQVILRNYGSLAEDDRVNLARRLADLPAGRGTSALCRLVRYDISERVSKEIAMLVLEQSPRQINRASVAALRDSLRGSQRMGSLWLLALALTVESPASSLSRWEQLAEQQRRVFAEHPTENDRLLSKRFFQWHVELLLRLDERKRAGEAIRRIMPLVEKDHSQVLAMSDWLLQQGFPEAFDDLADRFAELFQENAYLMYRLCESKRRRQAADAELLTLKRQAIAATQGDALDHVVVALSLQQDGLFEWAETEYRHVLETADDSPASVIQAQILLAEMLHDQQRSAQAAAVLQTLHDRCQDSESWSKVLSERFQRTPENLFARWHYFLACDQQARGEFEKQRQSLLRGSQASPHDVDLLIALYHLPDQSPESMAQVRTRIEEAAAAAKADIERAMKERDHAKTASERAVAEQELAVAYNRFAWLIANTEGNLNEALVYAEKCAHQLRPDVAGYLDTLGQAYFAVGRVDDAIRVQIRAARMEPHNGHVQRQLEKFRTAQRPRNDQGADDSSEPSPKSTER